MPVVPTFQRQVQTNVQTLVDMPAGAFGENIAVANQQMGNALQNAGQLISQRATELQQQKDTQKILDTEVKYRQEMDDLLYNTETGLLNRTLGNAEGAYSEFRQKTTELKQKYQGELVSENQKRQFGQLADNHNLAGEQAVLRHEADQTRESKIQTLATNLQLNASDAAKSPSIDNTTRLLSDGYAKLTHALGQMGYTPEDIKVKQQEYAGQLVAGVLEKSLAANDVAGARNILKQFGDQVSPDVKSKAESMIQEAGFYSDGNTIWNTVQGLKMSDGLPDLAKMEKSAKEAYKKLGYTDKMIEKGLDYIRSKAGELNTNLMRQWDANDRSFMNSVSAIHQQGGTMDVALKQIGKFARDSYDKEIKEDAVKRLWLTKQQSDPGVYMSLWKGVLYKTTPEKDIDEAMKAGKLTVQDWEELKKSYYHGQLDGVKQDVKSSWERIELLATQKFGSNKEKKQEFLYEMHQSGKGKSPEELLAIADQKLQKVGGWWIFGGEQQYKKDVKQRDETNRSWGQVYNTFGGKDVTLEIGRGLAAISGKNTFGADDLEQFIKQVGGSDKVKQGSPIYNAVKSIIKLREATYDPELRNQLITTPELIQQIIQQFPDGNVPAYIKLAVQ
jgi:hypothetical protein